MRAYVWRAGKNLPDRLTADLKALIHQISKVCLQAIKPDTPYVMHVISKDYTQVRALRAERQARLVQPNQPKCAPRARFALPGQSGVSALSAGGTWRRLASAPRRSRGLLCAHRSGGCAPALGACGRLRVGNLLARRPPRWTGSWTRRTGST